MLELSRTVRFCLNGASGGEALAERHNGFSAWPPMRGLGRFYQLHVCCAGEADPLTGYFINITHIDAAVRGHVLPFLEEILAETPASAAVAMGGLMRRLAELLHPPLHATVVRLGLELTPYHRLEIETHDMDHLIVRQQFEFSAAHRLHVPSLSDEENRRTFGKCNHPSGHGHNYRLEVAVRAPIDAQGRVVPVEQLDELVDRTVIQKLDHKHLNLDVEQFRSPGGLNPSVENIARVIYEMLEGEVAALGAGAELAEVSVWETSKTVCTYRGRGVAAAR